MNMDTQDRKRPRTEIDAEEAIRKQLTQHPTLYFEDGNMLLQCHLTLFCVHRSLLAKHSIVLRDEITANTYTLDGMACLATNDDIEDMESLLKMLYDGMYVDAEVLTVETFPRIAGLLRICTKYDVQRPRAAILERLRAEWPIALENHDAKVEDLYRRLRMPGSVAEDLVVHPAAVIALLRDCGYAGADLLSPLFYDLSTRVWQIGPPVTGHHFAPLSLVDLERFMIGLNALRNYQMVSCMCPATVLLNHNHNPNHGAGFLAPERNICAAEASRLWTNIVGGKIAQQLDLQCDPINEWKAFPAALKAQIPPARASPLCNGCCFRLPAVAEETRRTMWESMPAFFKLV